MKKLQVYTCTISIAVHDEDHLERVMKKLDKIPEVDKNGCTLVPEAVPPARPKSFRVLAFVGKTCTFVPSTEYPGWFNRQGDRTRLNWHPSWFRRVRCKPQVSKARPSESRDRKAAASRIVRQESKAHDLLFQRLRARVALRSRELVCTLTRYDEGRRAAFNEVQALLDGKD